MYREKKWKKLLACIVCALFAGINRKNKPEKGKRERERASEQANGIIFYGTNGTQKTLILNPAWWMEKKEANVPRIKKISWIFIACWASGTYTFHFTGKSHVNIRKSQWNSSARRRTSEKSNSIEMKYEVNAYFSALLPHRSLPHEQKHKKMLFN